jgi:hypothetical protein
MVRPGDLVALVARVPEIEKRSPLWSLARFHVTLHDVDSKNEYADFRTLYANETPALVDEIEQQMLAELHSIPPRYDAAIRDAVVKTGRFQGKTVGDSIGNASKDELDSFLGYLASSPGSWIGNDWTFPRRFRWWVENGAPPK